MVDPQKIVTTVHQLDVIYGEVQELVVNHHIFWQVQQIIRTNPRLRESSNAFYVWMGSAFAQSAALAVRRQADRDKRSISLRRLLCELHAYPDLISRAYHRTLYTNVDQRFAQQLADGTYDRLVGNGADRLSVAEIQKEIDDLVASSGRVHHYVDRQVAHYDQRGLEQKVPTYDDLDQCIFLLERLVLRYLILVKGIGMSTLLPTFQYDWKAIFRFAWIERETGS